MKTILIIVATILGTIFLIHWMVEEDSRWLQDQRSDIQEVVRNHREILKSAPEGTLLFLREGSMYKTINRGNGSARTTLVYYCGHKGPVTELTLVSNRQVAELATVFTPDDPNYSLALEEFQRCGK